MRFLLREVQYPQGPENPPTEQWYAGRERDGVRWVKDDKLAWDFATRPSAESIRDRDRYLKHCEIVEKR